MSSAGASGARAALLALLVLAGAAVLAACGSGERAEETTGSSSGPGVVPLKLSYPIGEPAYHPEENKVFAVRGNGETLVQLEPNVRDFGEEDRIPRAVTLEQGLRNPAGENLAVGDARTGGRLYVPSPDADSVAIVEPDDMVRVRGFDAGDSPARVALSGLDVGGSRQTLFALSGDGSRVTAVTVGRFDSPAEVEVGGTDETLIVAGGAEGPPSFWVAGPEGVAHYAGSPPERAGQSSLEAGALAADETSPDRAYVARAGSGLVVAVEARDGEELAVTDEVNLNGDVEHLASDGDRLYAAGPETLYVLSAESLNRTLSVDLEPAMRRASVEGAAFSGMAVGGDFVYLAVEGEPYVILVERP